MILTFTANTALDYTVFLDDFGPGKHVHANDTVFSVGGKANNVSWFLHELGYDTLAMGFVGGKMGRQNTELLHQHGVETDFVWTDGETRINTVVMSPHEHTTLASAPTLIVRQEHIEQFWVQYRANIIKAHCVVIGGSLPKGVPPSFYAEMIREAHQHSVPVIIDVDEPNLSVALREKPTFIKPNRDEIRQLSGREVTSLEDTYQRGRELYDKYGVSMMITLGSEGALAILPDKSYYIPPLEVGVVSSAGAGDSVVAGLSVGMAGYLPIEEALRLSAAIAAGKLLRPGTADLRKEDVERFLPQIEVREYPGNLN